jgi:dihydroxy-acid dehydratase
MRSDLVKSGPDRAPSHAMLRATGLDAAAITQHFVAVVHTWTNVSSCNPNLRSLADVTEKGARAGAGGSRSRRSR